jgi:hypothetical protein
VLMKTVQIERDMNLLLDSLLIEPHAQPAETVQQEARQARSNEIKRLEAELAASHRKVAECEAIANQQFCLLNEENKIKSSKISDLERELATRIGSESLDDGQTAQLRKDMDAIRERLEEDMRLQKAQYDALKTENRVTLEERDSLRRKLRSCMDEKEALLAQFDSSDVFGDDYGNSNLGAAAQEDITAQQELSEALGEKIATIETLNGTMRAKEAVIEGLRTDLESRDSIILGLKADVAAKDSILEGMRGDITRKDASIEGLQQVVAENTQRFDMIDRRRHLVIDHDIFHQDKHVRDLDFKAIFHYSSYKDQWPADISTIIRLGSQLPGHVHITFLVIAHGVRSVLVNISLDKLANVKAVLSYVRSSDRDYALYLTFLDRTKSSVMARVLTHSADDAEDFVEVCQQDDARVFFGSYVDFSRFFAYYEAAYLREKESSSNKRVGDLLERSDRPHMRCTNTRTAQFLPLDSDEEL